MDEFKYDMMGKYAPGDQEINSWKEVADGYFGREEAVTVLNSLREFLPSADKDLVFLSPTANYPTHEEAMYWEAIHTRTGKTTFLVGDISKIKPTKILEEIAPYNNEDHQFTYFRWDADRLPIKKGSVDVLWDRKGWLWHSANEGGNKMVLKALRQYRDLLKPGGIIVTDAIQGRALQDEFSTVDLITSRGTAHTWDVIGSWFDYQDIGSGVSRCRVLQPKQLIHSVTEPLRAEAA